MKLELAVGVAVLTACSGGRHWEQAREDRARAQATEAGDVPGDVAGGETSEFSGNISACPEIASSEPIDLDAPEVASWVAMAQGHHEQTLGWRRLVQSDEVRGFVEHTTVSIDVNVPRGREVVYGSGGNTDYELAGCAGLRARQIQLDITLATADGAVVASYSSWFEPGPSDSRGTVLHPHGLNPDYFGAADVSGTLELRPDPALAGISGVGIDLEFSADSVRGTLAPEVVAEDTEWYLSAWRPIEAVFPDDPCGSQGRSIGLDDVFSDLGGTPRAFYQRMASARGRARLGAVWRSKSSQVLPSPSDVQLDLPPPTEVSLNAGEPIRACANGTSVIVYAPLTITTADGLVNVTQPFSFNLYEASAYIVERTPWVPAADFNEHIGLAGVNVERGYGSISFQNNENWQYGWLEGAIEVSQWDAFMDVPVAYPVLEWCRGPQCTVVTQ